MYGHNIKADSSDHTRSVGREPGGAKCKFFTLSLGITCLNSSVPILLF